VRRGAVDRRAVGIRDEGTTGPCPSFPSRRPAKCVEGRQVAGRAERNTVVRVLRITRRTGVGHSGQRKMGTARGRGFYSYVRSLGGTSLFDFSDFDPERWSIRRAILGRQDKRQSFRSVHSLHSGREDERHILAQGSRSWPLFLP
jgi:hypothetical protein